MLDEMAYRFVKANFLKTSLQNASHINNYHIESIIYTHIFMMLIILSNVKIKE